jgi:ABC-type multidrug transport system ATPase subunit
VNQNQEIDGNLQYRFVSIASPYLALIEEFNVEELLRFHFRLKSMLPGITNEDFIDRLQLQNISGKPIKQYSSGMKQRLRLALAFFTQAPVLLLDEPCSNLDTQGVEWYRNLLDSFTQDRLVLICSNHQENEYQPCENVIDISFYKQATTLKYR